MSGQQGTVPAEGQHVESEHGAYMVGSLARFNINYEQLRPEAQAAAETMGLEIGTPIEIWPIANE